MPERFILQLLELSTKLGRRLYTTSVTGDIVVTPLLETTPLSSPPPRIQALHCQDRPPEPVVDVHDAHPRAAAVEHGE